MLISRTRNTGLSPIEEEIDNYFDFYNHPIDEIFLKSAYDFLIEKQIFEGVDYRFLCWLNHFYDYPIKINKPYFVSPVEYSISGFEKDFLFNEKRKTLFKSLTGYIDFLKACEKFDILTVLIGGSFSDKNNEPPDDIDAVILLPIKNDFDQALEAISQSDSAYFPEKVDVKFLPVNYTLENFKAYSHITCLGNNARFKKKERYSNNEFEKRKIIKIEL